MSSNLNASKSEIKGIVEEVTLENCRSATGYLADTESSGSFSFCRQCGMNRGGPLKRKYPSAITRPSKRRRTLSPLRPLTNLPSQIRRKRKQRRKRKIPTVTTSPSQQYKFPLGSDPDCDSPLEESLPDIRMGGTNGLIFRIFTPNHDRITNKN